MAKCSVHGTTLVNKEIPIFYGMPTPETDEIFTRVATKFPKHGLWSLAGCVIVGDGSDETTARDLVCDHCYNAAKQLI